MIRILCCALALFAVGSVVADDVPISAFAQLPDFEDAKISPDGTYLAVMMPSEKKSTVGIIRLSDGKLLKGLAMPGKVTGIADYHWVGPRRLVFELAEQYGSLELPVRTGELIALDVDASNGTYLFGELAGTGQQAGMARGWATVIDPLPEDPHHAIISANDWDEDSGGADSRVTTAYEVDVDSGHLVPKAVSPITGSTTFITDTTGAVRYAVGQGHGTQDLTYYRDVGSNDWKLLNTDGLKHAGIEPLRFSKDGTKVYLKSDEGGDKACLVEHNLSTNARKKLSCDDTADLGATYFSPANVPLAAVYGNDRPHLQWLDSADPELAALQQLQKAFPGEIAVPVSQTVDGSKIVALVYSDRDPGAYYLFDPNTLKAEALLETIEAIKPEQMGERRPIQFKARDGTLIHGYLTLPPGKPVKDLPLVVNPHGGPFWIHDGWRWEPEPQMLATRGYAVLQVNFRGSGGFGKQFIEQGKQHWDSVMIDDITDGARWVAGQGIADSHRMCIYGGSYGGYASLMSALREPDLYRCVIDYAGVYDLNIQKSRSDTSESAAGRAYLAEFMAGTPEQLTEASPASKIDKLKAAIMIVHGEDDPRVPIANAKALRKALEKMGHPYEWLTKPGEGHGFSKTDNRIEFYTRMLEFLDKNIGAGAVAVAGGDAPQAAPAATPVADSPH